MTAEPTGERQLRGFTIGITADRRWEEQAALFERRGATVIHGPSIRTLPLGADGPLRAVTEQIAAEPPDVVIANTGLGVRSWFGSAESWGLGDALAASLRQARIYARGPKASGAVHSAGLDVIARARSERLHEVVELILQDLRPGQRVVLQLDGSGESPETGRLREAGAKVIPVPVYRWTAPEDAGPALRLAEATVAGRVHAVTFTAGPAIRNWLDIAATAGLQTELRAALTDGRVVVGCVGPVCAEAAVAEGLSSPNLAQPDAYRLGPLVRAVTELLTERRLTVPLGRAILVLSGTTASVGNVHVELSDTEARLLAALARRPNAVLTKAYLLRTVWGGDSQDPHTVEVGVARLRKRLGEHGAAIRAVHRRGYTLGRR